MADSKSTTLLEEERADRFGKARSPGYVVWTKEQRENIDALNNEQPTAEEEAAEQNATAIEDKFNQF